MYWILGVVVYLFLGLGFGLLLEMFSTSFTKQDLVIFSVLWLFVLISCAAVQVSMIPGDLVYKHRICRLKKRIKKLS